MNNSAICPQCGATGFEFCKGHKIKVKGGFDADFVKDVCFKCGYESKAYSARTSIKQPFVIVTPPRPVKQAIPITDDEKITFTARKGDLEISIKVGKDGISKLLSMFMEVQQ